MSNNRDYGNPDVVYPTTVTLVADAEDKLKIFFCFSSQTPLIQYKGRVISVLPGLSPYEPYTILKCKDSRCPMAFIFSPLVQMSERYLHVM